MPRRVARIAVISFLAALGGFTTWDRLVKPHVLPKRLGEVSQDRIYRSGKLTPATMTAVVRDHDIKTVVDLGAWVHDPRGERLEAQACRVLGVERHVFDLLGDSTGDPNDYVEALRLMTDPANQPVLVHCGAGTERTGAIVYFYRTIVEGVAPEQALAEARRAGHDPRRNPLLAQTIERWGDQIARAYREGGRIDVPAGSGASLSGQARESSADEGAATTPPTSAAQTPAPSPPGDPS